VELWKAFCIMQSWKPIQQLPLMLQAPLFHVLVMFKFTIILPVERASTRTLLLAGREPNDPIISYSILSICPLVSPSHYICSSTRFFRTSHVEIVTPQVFSSLIALHLHEHKQASFISCISLICYISCEVKVSKVQHTSTLCAISFVRYVKHFSIT
jgi:hypothetical protein